MSEGNDSDIVENKSQSWLRSQSGAELRGLCNQCMAHMPISHCTNRRNGAITYPTANEETLSHWRKPNEFRCALSSSQMRIDRADKLLLPFVSLSSKRPPDLLPRWAFECLYPPCRHMMLIIALPDVQRPRHNVVLHCSISAIPGMATCRLQAIRLSSQPIQYKS